jgi:hypothetical protein
MRKRETKGEGKVAATISYRVAGGERKRGGGSSEVRRAIYAAGARDGVGKEGEKREEASGFSMTRTELAKHF